MCLDIMMNNNESNNIGIGLGCCGLALMMYAAYAAYILLKPGGSEQRESACINLLIALGALWVLGAYIQSYEKAHERDQRSSPPGIVYIIKSGKHYKIGMTRGNLESRLKSIQTGSPYKIEIIHTIETATPEKLEAELHRRFRGKRLSGEWFDLNQSDIWNIKRMQ